VGSGVDVITDAKFLGNQLRGYGVTGPPNAICYT